LVFTLRILIPRFGGPRTIALGPSLLVMTCTAIVYIWTPTTPTEILVPAILLQGFALGPVLLGATNIATSQAALPDLNDASTSCFFVRQLGNTLGVTAVTVLFDRRMTLHSSRLLDVANRVDPIVQSTLTQYTNLIHRNGGGSNPSLGALQIFQADMITQSRLLSYIDIYFGLATLAGLALILLAVARVKNRAVPNHFHLW
jgi:DHA2 family multidrug resistance protein